MSDDKHPVPILSDPTGTIATWVKDAVRQVKLTWRLLFDPRVPLWSKIIPPATLIYLLSPVDIVPDVALGLGQMDDIAILLLGLKLFIEIAPPEIVREHMQALGARIKEWRVVEDDEQQERTPAAAIEGGYKVVDMPPAEKETAKGASET